jgi:hypothetical protein
LLAPHVVQDGPGRAVIAGAIIGSILGAALLGLAAYYLVYDHMVRQYKTDIFRKVRLHVKAAFSEVEGRSQRSHLLAASMTLRAIQERDCLHARQSLQAH